MSKTLGKIDTMVRRLWKGDCGQDLVEYGLAVTLLALLCISGMQTAAGSLNDAFDEVSQALVPPTPAPPPPPHHHRGHR
jgi:Flp pilus assembly pilin Flp